MLVTQTKTKINRQVHILWTLWEHCMLERSENTLFWKLQKAHMVYGPRHNTDFRTIDEIIIG